MEYNHEWNRILLHPGVKEEFYYVPVCLDFQGLNGRNSWNFEISQWNNYLWIFREDFFLFLYSLKYNMMYIHKHDEWKHKLTYTFLHKYLTKIFKAYNKT